MNAKKITCIFISSLFLMNTVLGFSSVPAAMAEETVSEAQDEIESNGEGIEEITNKADEVEEGLNKAEGNEEVPIDDQAEDIEEADEEDTPEQDLEADDDKNIENDDAIEADSKQDNSETISEETVAKLDYTPTSSWDIPHCYYDNNAIKLEYYKDSINKYSSNEGVINKNDTLEIKINTEESGSANFYIDGVQCVSSDCSYSYNSDGNYGIAKIGSSLLKDLEEGTSHTFRTEICTNQYSNQYGIYISYDVNSFTFQVEDAKVGGITYTDDTSLPTDSSVFKVENGEITGLNLTDEEKTKVSTVKIPETIDDAAISKIGKSAFEGCTNLKSVNIQSRIVEIGERAFADCTSLKDINFPSALTTIGKEAFENCALIKVDFQEGLTKIDENAFKGCSGLKDLTIPYTCDNIAKNSFETGTLENISVWGGTSDINSYQENKFKKMFMNSECIQNFNTKRYCLYKKDGPYTGEGGPYRFTYDNRVIYGSSVPDDKSIYRIDIPSDAQELMGAEFAYDSYPSLKILKMPYSAYISNSQAFNTYTPPYSYTQTRDVTIIKEYGTVRNKDKLQSLLDKFGDDFGSIAVNVEDSESSFKNKNCISEVSVKDGVKYLKDDAFKNCKSLTRLIIPYDCKLNRTTFKGCYNLSDVTVTGNASDEEKLQVKEKIEQSIAGEGESSITASYAEGASENAVIDESLFKVENGVITGLNISDEDKAKLASIVVPEEINGVEIKGISDNLFSNCTSLTKVQIADTIESIGENVFRGCTSLNDVNLGVSLKEIGNAAFMGCSNLTEIDIPEGVSKINPSLFSDCTNLKNIKLPSTLTNIGPWSFINCINLENIDMPDSVTEIGSAAFFNCWGLKVVTIPENIESLGDSAFLNCMNLKNISISYTCTNFEKSTFQYDNKLVSIVVNGGSDYEKAYLQEKVRKSINGEDIGDYVPDIKETIVTYTDDASKNAITDDTIFDVENGVLTGLRVDESDKSKITSIKIPEKIDGVEITGIGDNLFTGCTALSKVELSQVLKSIGAQAFYKCTALNDIDIPLSVNRIGDAAFWGCTSLTKMDLKEGITEIENSAFAECSGLTDVVLPDSLTKIGAYTFMNCYHLKNINLPDSITEIGDLVFCNCWEFTDVKLPKNLKSIPTWAFAGCNNLLSIDIPDTVESVGDSAFMGCAKLKEISFDDAITSMGTGILENCTNITTVKLPRNVTTISEKMFKNCANLQTIKMPYMITGIGNEAFYGCPKITSMTMQA